MNGAWGGGGGGSDGDGDGDVGNREVEGDHGWSSLT